MRRFFVLSVLALAIVLHGNRAQAQSSADPKALVAGYCRSVAAGSERAGALEGACMFSLTVQQKLPNYICEEKIKRYETVQLSIMAGRLVKSRSEQLKDVIEAQVTVEGGKDSYSNVKVNGRPAEKMLQQMPGMLSAGEFGVQLTHLFAPHNKARFEFKREAKLKSRRALLFTFEIREGDNKSFNVWDLNGLKWDPGYSGYLWVDKKTLRPLRLEIQSTALRFRFVFQNVAASTEYGEVPLADGTRFLLPVKSSVKACGETTCLRNELEFRNCHKFVAKARIMAAE